MSTCSGLAALDHANTKHSKGYATSGIVCTTCRHEFILPEGAGPLQKGERSVFNSMSFAHATEFYDSYANTDYVVVRSTSHNPKTKKVASYDIMCQWSINLGNRLKDFPLVDANHLDRQIVARVVPKFHLAAHKESCRINFSLNYEPGVGRSDMEGPERTWFGLQGGGSTKDQGPGYWSDAMDDKFGHWNWSKLVRLGGVPLFYFYAMRQQSDPRLQVRSLRRSMPMPSHSQLPIRMRSPPLVSTFLKTLLTHGPRKSIRGSSIVKSQTHISTPHLVRLIAHVS